MRTDFSGLPGAAPFGTAEFHNLVGKYLAEREQQTGRVGKSLLAACYRCGVPAFTSSPGDSSIGMNLAALMLEGSKLRIDPLRDVNQSAAVVWDAKAKANIGHLMIPAGLPSGTYVIQITAEDFAHNSSATELVVEVIGT